MSAERAEVVKAALDVLRKYYTDREGQPHKLNATQIAVYLDGLAAFTAEELEAAAREHMKRSRFFPALSDLLALLDPPEDYDALAHVAWSQLEREIRRIGAYRSAEFSDPAFGQAVRQVFGSWAQACSFDLDSPAWAIRRQTFLQVFPQIVKRGDAEPVTLYGLDRYGERMLVGHLRGLPGPSRLLQSGDRSRGVLAEVRRRFDAQRGISDGR